MEEVTITTANTEYFELGMVLDMSNTTSVKSGQYVITGWVDSNTVTLVALTGWRLLWHRFKDRLYRIKRFLSPLLWWKLQDAYWEAFRFIESKFNKEDEEGVLLRRRMWWKVQDAYWDAKNWVVRKLGIGGDYLDR